jgi:hypothetical protein
MVVVLCHVADLPALWAARGLERRGVAVEVITAPALSCALEWEYRLDGERTSVSVGLPDGRRLSSAEPVGVLNRLTAVSPERLDAVGGPDRDYALQELHALFLSWLQALPGPVVNRPTPQGLCGSWRHPSEWAVLAAQAGLEATTYRQSSFDPPDAALEWGPALGPSVTAFVVGEQVVPSAPGVPRAVLNGCRLLGRLARETLLGVELAPSDGRWAVKGASVMPDLRLGGEALLDALEPVLAA